MKRLVLIMMMVAVPVWAKPAPELIAAIRQVFEPANGGHSFISSQVPLDMAKVRGFAVIKKAGIPAGQAYWFITHQDYEYRPFIVKGDNAKTYLGKVEVELQPGTIMAISSTEVFQKNVEIKLLSKDVIAAKGGALTSHDTRAAVAMVFKFPELKMTEADAPAILAKIQDYITPADSLTQAEQVAAQLNGGNSSVAVGKPTSKIVAPAPKVTPVADPASKVAPAIAPATVAATPTKTAGVVHTGMKYDEVKRISGEPKRTITRGNAVVFDYGDHEVIFAHEEVQDIRWK